VKDDSVVESLAGEFLDPRHMLGRYAGQHLDDDPAALDLHHKCVFGIRRGAGLGRRICHDESNYSN